MKKPVWESSFAGAESQLSVLGDLKVERKNERITSLIILAWTFEKRILRKYIGNKWW